MLRIHDVPGQRDDSLTEVNESEEKGDLPDDWRERKFKYDLEHLCNQFLQAGGDAQVGAALLMRTSSDVLGIAVLRQVQDEFERVLAFLVNKVSELEREKGETGVSTESTESGAAPGERRPEDGKDGSPVVDSGDGGEGG